MSLSDMIRRRFADRGYYANGRGWRVSLYNRALSRWPRAPLPFRGAIYPVRVAGLESSLLVRLATSDWLVLEEIFFRQEYAAVIEGAAGPIHQVVDLGANCGLSMRLWRNHYPNARIVCVEPDPGNAKMVRLNANAAGATADVTVIEACAAAEPRTVYLKRGDGEWAFNMSDSPEGGGVPVQATTLPTILDQAKVQGQIDLLKCDIEGAERELFSNCGDWIGRVRNLMVELDHPYASQQFLEDVRRGGGNFETVFIREKDKNHQLVFLRAK